MVEGIWGRRCDSTFFYLCTKIVSGQLHALTIIYQSKQSLVTYQIGGWMGPRPYMNSLVKRKMSSLLWVFNNISLVIQPVAYTDYVVPAWQVPSSDLHWVTSSPGTNVMFVLSLSKFKH